MNQAIAKMNMKFNNAKFNKDNIYNYNNLGTNDEYENVEVIDGENKKQTFSYGEFQTFFDKI